MGKGSEVATKELWWSKKAARAALEGPLEGKQGSQRVQIKVVNKGEVVEIDEPVGNKFEDKQWIFGGDEDRPKGLDIEVKEKQRSVDPALRVEDTGHQKDKWSG